MRKKKRKTKKIEKGNRKIKPGWKKKEKEKEKEREGREGRRNNSKLPAKRNFLEMGMWRRAKKRKILLKKSAQNGREGIL